MVFSAITAALTSIGTGISTAATAAGTAAGAASTAAAGSSLGGIGAALSGVAGIAGTVMQYTGAQKAAEGAEKAEKLREAQMNMEASRERRQVIRQAAIARSQALTSATAQNAGEGSGLAGGMAQITSQAGSNITGINQGQQIGQGMFAANRQIASGQTMQSIGGAFQNFSSYIGQNTDQNNRVWGW